jgi:hypothetical protein
VRRLRLLLAGGVVAVLSLPSAASAASCTTVAVKDKLAGADVAFVGRVVARNPLPRANGIPQFEYVFSTSHVVKGTQAGRVTVRSARLVDLSGVALTPSFHEDVGVLAGRGVGGALVTSSCGLVDAVTLLDESDHPKGGLIKVAIGLLIAASVIGYSLRRLRRRGDAPRPNPLG